MVKILKFLIVQTARFVAKGMQVLLHFSRLLIAHIALDLLDSAGLEILCSSVQAKISNFENYENEKKLTFQRRHHQ